MNEEHSYRFMYSSRLHSTRDGTEQNFQSLMRLSLESWGFDFSRLLDFKKVPLSPCLIHFHIIHIDDT